MTFFCGKQFGATNYHFPKQVSFRTCALLFVDASILEVMQIAGGNIHRMRHFGDQVLLDPTHAHFERIRDFFPFNRCQRLRDSRSSSRRT